MKSQSLIKTLFVLTFGLMASSLFASGGSSSTDSSSSSSRRGETCSAYDHGFEEHSGGHSSCGSCLADHGGCTMRCFQEEFKCEATGTDRDGREISAVAYSGRSERDARIDAEDRCYARGGRDCYARCTTERTQSDSYDCGRQPTDSRNTCTWQDYLRQRPDVAAAAGFGNSRSGAVSHYERHGRNEGMCRPI